MIDFRYHLVSLVSVFLALAVGIVLGAGPLKEPIATGLTQSVDSLRQDLDEKGKQLGTAQAGISNRDTFVTQVTPGLVADQLGGRSVVLVTLPGADGDGVRPLTSTLTAAGAKVTGRIDIQDAWADPSNRAARDKAVAALAGVAGTGTTALVPSASRSAGAGSPAPSAGSSPRSSGTPAATTGPGGTSPGGDPAGDAAAAALLARAVLTTDLGASERTDDVERSLLDGLSKAGLIDVNGDIPGRATQAVVLAPGVAQAVQGQPAPATSTGPDLTPTWLTLARELDTSSTGAVVVGPASAAAAGGVLAAVRAQSQLAGSLSTVDTGGTPMGDVTTVFALREQQLGGAGNYGFADGAKAPLPTRAAGGS